MGPTDNQWLAPDSYSLGYAELFVNIWCDPYFVCVQMYAVADSARPVCDLTPIKFERTPMLQQSSFAFPLSSSSLARLHYKWIIQDANGAMDSSGTYQVKLEDAEQTK